MRRVYQLVVLVSGAVFGLHRRQQQGKKTTERIDFGFVRLFLKTKAHSLPPLRHLPEAAFANRAC